MALPEQRVVYSVEEYLELERQADERHQYIDGEIFEMSGESLAHSRIAINLAGELQRQLKGKPCEALSGRRPSSRLDRLRTATQRNLRPR